MLLYLKVSPGPMSKKYSSCSTIFIDDNTVSQPNLKSTIKWWENFTHTQAHTMLCCPKVSKFTWENPVASQRGNLEVILNGCMTETDVLTPNLGQSFVLPWFWRSCKTTFHQDYLSVPLNEASIQEVRHTGYYSPLKLFLLKLKNTKMNPHYVYFPLFSLQCHVSNILPHQKQVCVHL